MSYDERGRVISSVVDPTGINAQTTLEYDAKGNISKVTAPNGSYVVLEYDGNDRVTKISNNLNESISYTYDVMGNTTLAETKNASNISYFKSQSAFDELGRLLQVTRAGAANWNYGYDKVGNLLTLTDPNNKTATANYDSLDRLVSFVDERNDTTSWTHDASNAVSSTTDARTVTTAYVRNGWGELIQEGSNDIGTVVYERNQRGDIIKKTDARGQVVDISYDNAGRMTSATYPSDFAINVTYNYDAGANGIGNLTSVNDAAGTIIYNYDTKGRVIQETRTISNQTYVIGYEWDADDNITKIIYPSGREVTYGRDSIGNISQILTRETASSGDVGIAWWVSTTPFGPRQGMLHGNGLTDWRTYDEDGRLLTQYLQDTSSTPANLLLDRYYAYQDNRNLTQITDSTRPSQAQYYSYTDNGYLLNGSGPWGSIYFGTDGVGNLTQRSLTSGSTTSNTFSA